MIEFDSRGQELLYFALLALRQMGFTPSPEQREILSLPNRIVLVSGGEQAGKSYLAAMYGLSRMTLQAGKLYWLVGDDYDQSKREFEYMVQGLRTVNAVKEEDISMPIRGAWQMRAFDRRVHIITKTAKDVRKLGREAPDGILINEAAQCSFDVYTKCLGRTAPKRGWLFLSGTLESGADWYANSLQRWQAPNDEDATAKILPSWANLSLYPEGRADPEIKRMERLLPHDEFMRRFGAVVTKPKNLVLPEFDYHIHIPGDVRFEPHLPGQDHVPEEVRERWPVQLWIDVGYSGSWYAVEVVQIAYPDHHCDLIHAHVVDELYVKLGLTPMIISECMMADWWENVEQVVIDIAGTTHDALPSHAEIWNSQAEVPVLYEKIAVEDGILRHRTFLKDPGTGQARIFYNESCAGVTKEYGRWKRRMVTGLVNQSAKPQIINCDGLKAINYGLVANFGYVDVEGEPAELKNPFSW